MMLVPCCQRLGVTPTTFGRLLRSSQHKQHRKFYVDYDFLRFKLKRCVADSGNSDEFSTVWNEFDNYLLTSWQTSFDHTDECLAHFEEHLAILTAQHTKADNSAGHVFDQTENTAFQRVYSKLHERVKAVKSFWINNKSALKDLEARRKAAFEELSTSADEVSVPASHLMTFNETSLLQRFQFFEARVCKQFLKLEPSYDMSMAKSTMKMFKDSKVYQKKAIFFRCGMVLMLGVHIVWDLVLEFENFASAFSEQWLSATSLMFQVGNVYCGHDSTICNATWH